MTPLGRAEADLSVRRRQAELMDDPALDADRHRTALRALARINRVSLAGDRLWREVARVAPTVEGPVRVLDLACGGGDVLARVVTRASRAGVAVRLVGLDASPRAVDEARRALGASGEAVEADVLAGPLPAGFHVVTSSLFLHHLSRPDAVELLRRMADATRRTIFVQDLARTRLGFALAWIGLHTLTRSDVARVDGIRSVQGAFTLSEARALCVEAGLQGAEVGRAWPERITVRWLR